MNINPTEIPLSIIETANVFINNQEQDAQDSIHQARLNIALKNGYSEDEPDLNSPLEIETYLQ